MKSALKTRQSNPGSDAAMKTMASRMLFGGGLTMFPHAPFLGTSLKTKHKCSLIFLFLSGRRSIVTIQTIAEILSSRNMVQNAVSSYTRFVAAMTKECRLLELDVLSQNLPIASW